MRKDKLVFDTGPLLLYFAEDNRVRGSFDEVMAGDTPTTEVRGLLPFS